MKPREVMQAAPGPHSNLVSSNPGLLLSRGPAVSVALGACGRGLQEKGKRGRDPEKGKGRKMETEEPQGKKEGLGGAQRSARRGLKPLVPTTC